MKSPQLHSPRSASAEESVNQIRLQRILHSATLYGAFGHVLITLVFWWFAVDSMMWFNILISIPLFIAGHFLNRAGYSDITYSLCLSEVYVHQVIGIYLLGWEAGLQNLLFMLAPMAFFNASWSNRTQLACFTAVIVTYLIFQIALGDRRQYQLLPWQYQMLTTSSAIVGMMLFAMVLQYYVRTVAISQRKLISNQRQLEITANTDSLTQLLNRRGFNAKYQSAVEYCSRYGDDLALILFDIDNFKRVNDSHGHDCGDQVLIAVSRAAETCIRSTDTLARHGGEEFALLLPKTDLSNACKVAEKVRVAVENAQVAISGNKRLSCTISLGVSHHNRSSLTTAINTKQLMESLLREADDALYQAKRTGKNRLVSAKTETD